MLREAIGPDTITKTAQLLLSLDFYPLLLSPAAVKAVARFVYGLGQLYDSFCLSAASERLYQLQTAASGPFQRL